MSVICRWGKKYLLPEFEEHKEWTCPITIRGKLKELKESLTKMKAKGAAP